MEKLHFVLCAGPQKNPQDLRNVGVGDISLKLENLTKQMKNFEQLKTIMNINNKQT
jgi:hypothetical protein